MKDPKAELALIEDDVLLALAAIQGFIPSNYNLVIIEYILQHLQAANARAQALECEIRTGNPPIDGD